MSILTPEAGQPYIRHVIFSFGIRPVASRLRAAQRRCMSEIGSNGGCPDREVAPKVLPYDKTNSASRAGLCVHQERSVLWRIRPARLLKPSDLSPIRRRSSCRGFSGPRGGV